MTYFYEIRIDLNWVQGSGFKVQGSGFRVQGSGFRVRGCDARRAEVDLVIFWVGLK